MVTFLLTIILISLVFETRSFLCCAGSVPSTIDAEDRFSSRRGEWWGHNTHAYDHYWCMEWSRRSPTRVSKSRRRSRVDPVRVPEVEAKSNSSSSLVWSPGAVRNKTDAQVTYRVGFGRSIYGWKQNFIDLPMALVSCQNSSPVNRNRRNKLMSRICQSAASTVWLGLRPKLGAPHPWSPQSWDAPSLIFSVAAALETWVWFIF
jgi:hypothetical protein